MLADNRKVVHEEHLQTDIGDEGWRDVLGSNVELTVWITRFSFMEFGEREFQRSEMFLYSAVYMTCALW